MIDREKISAELVRMVPNEPKNIDHCFSPQWEWEEFKDKGAFYGNQIPGVDADWEPYDNWN